MQSKDIPYLEDELKSMWVAHSQKYPNIISSKVLENTNVEKYLSPFISKIGGFVLVAVNSDKVVGMLKVEEQKLEDFFIEEKAYFIDDLVVLKEFRGQGVASLLIDNVISIAKENSVSIIKSRIYTFNDPAIKTFLSNGFENLYSEYIKTGI